MESIAGFLCGILSWIVISWIFNKIRPFTHLWICRWVVSGKRIIPHIQHDSEKGKIRDYDEVVRELEQLQKDRADEITELIYLRWCNACLRHELFRRNKGKEGKLEGKKLETEEFDFAASYGEMGGFAFDDSGSDSSILGHEHEDPSFGFSKESRGKNSKRRKLYKKIKKWVEGSQKVRKQQLEEKRKTELKLFGSHSVEDFGDEAHVPGMKSSTTA